MDDESTSSSLYATVTACKEPVPEEAQHLRHHLKGGRGFTNPWDSWKDMSAPRIMKEILWYYSSWMVECTSDTVLSDIR